MDSRYSFHITPNKRLLETFKAQQGAMMLLGNWKYLIETSMVCARNQRESTISGHVR